MWSRVLGSVSTTRGAAPANGHFMRKLTRHVETAILFVTCPGVSRRRRQAEYLLELRLRALNSAPFLSQVLRQAIELVPRGAAADRGGSCRTTPPAPRIPPPGRQLAAAVSAADGASAAGLLSGPVAGPAGGPAGPAGLWEQRRRRSSTSLMTASVDSDDGGLPLFSDSAAQRLEPAELPNPKCAGRGCKVQRQGH